jgi:predicted hotdog family 3-hydroxylacyl-ACP dehydratase
MTNRTVLDRSGMDCVDLDRFRGDRLGIGCASIDRASVDHNAIDRNTIDRDSIAALIPHSGGMVLLDRVVSWDQGRITCRTRSHLDPANPLRRAGRLAAACGIEYALQAAALHGGLAAGGTAQQAGFLAALRDVTVHFERLDDQAIGDLHVEARLERHEEGGSIYALELRSQVGRVLLSGRAVIALPRPRRA